MTRSRPHVENSMHLTDDRVYLFPASKKKTFSNQVQDMETFLEDLIESKAESIFYDEIQISRKVEEDDRKS